MTERQLFRPPYRFPDLNAFVNEQKDIMGGPVGQLNLERQEYLLYSFPVKFLQETGIKSLKSAAFPFKDKRILYYTDSPDVLLLQNTRSGLVVNGAYIDFVPEKPDDQRQIGELEAIHARPLYTTADTICSDLSTSSGGSARLTEGSTIPVRGQELVPELVIDYDYINLAALRLFHTTGNLTPFQVLHRNTMGPFGNRDTHFNYQNLTGDTWSEYEAGLRIAVKSLQLEEM